MTEVQHLERSMFGTYAKQTFSLKAAETNYYIEFLIALIDKVSRVWTKGVSSGGDCA